MEQLKRDVPQEATDRVRLDGTPTIQADLLKIDFRKPDFDRSRPAVPPPEGLSKGDPPVSLAFEVANSFLGKIRSVTQAAFIRPLGPEGPPWRIDYLNDDETELPPDPALIRTREGTSLSWRVCGLKLGVWDKIRSLPGEFRPAAWETILLDAEALLPQVNPSIVLAFTALETFIEQILNHFVANSAIPPALWKWITERSGFDRLTPSVQEEFDELLRILGGRSLKDEGRLWEAFQNLRKARNSVLHEGVAKIGNQEVTSARAAELVDQAKAIATWLEQILPEGRRRPIYQGAFNWHFEMALGARVGGDGAQPRNGADG